MEVAAGNVLSTEFTFDKVESDGHWKMIQYRSSDEWRSWLDSLRTQDEQVRQGMEESTRVTKLSSKKKAAAKLTPTAALLTLLEPIVEKILHKLEGKEKAMVKQQFLDSLARRQSGRIAVKQSIVVEDRRAIEVNRRQKELERLQHEQKLRQQEEQKLRQEEEERRAAEIEAKEQRRLQRDMKRQFDDADRAFVDQVRFQSVGMSVGMLISIGRRISQTPW